MPLSTERATMTRTEMNGQIDRGFLPLDLSFSFFGVRVRKAGRETHHRRFLADGGDQSRDGVDIPGCKTAKEPVVMLDPFPSETRGLLDPLLERGLSRHEFVELVFRKHADAGRHA